MVHHFVTNPLQDSIIPSGKKKQSNHSCKIYSYIFVKLDHFHRDRDENKTYLKPPPRPGTPVVEVDGTALQSRWGGMHARPQEVDRVTGVASDNQ